MALELLRDGDSSALLRLPRDLAAVGEAFARLSQRAHPAIQNLHPAYASLLIEFDPLRLSFAELERELRACLANVTSTPAAATPRRRHTIPVRYDGPDLEEVAKLHGLAREEIISLHARPIYRVSFLGFQPGFAYLEGLSPKLATPRLSTPRRKVAAGSVGIAGGQTGIYPLDSPGGWRILGHTSLTLFDPRQDSPALLAMGDEVQFVRVA